MALPLRHALQRAGRIPGGAVGAGGCDRVVDVADRAHARLQTDLLTGEPMGIAAAVELLVVVQCDVERHLGHPDALLEQLVAMFRMGSHHLELFVGQRARLVQHVQRHLHLADVMQQPGQAGLADLFLRVAKLARQADHQRADGHGMHIGVVVAGLEPRQTDEGGRIAGQGLGDLLDDRQAAVGIDGLAQPGLAKHRHHGLPGPVEHLAGALDFGLQAGAGRRRRARGLRCIVRGGLGAGLGQAELKGRCSLGGHDVGALADVDPDLGDLAAAQQGQVGRIVQHELGLPERVRQPRPFQSLEVHPELDLRGGNLFQHG
mmetsp:Transcript_1095/g.2972  ORF Transcript_1095/g.2972 Transcript_1095/m.2972 type:complete len:318 (-) Transcript_1095:2694-3647(-)